MGWFSRIFSFVFAIGRRRAEAEVTSRVDAVGGLTDQEKADIKGATADALDQIREAGAEPAAKPDEKTSGSEE